MSSISSAQTSAELSVKIHGVRTLRVPRALAWRSSLSPCALSRHVYIRDTSCKQTTLIALHKAITTADRTIHISLCIATFSHCLHCNTIDEDTPRDNVCAAQVANWLIYTTSLRSRNGIVVVCGGECSEANDHVEQLSKIRECIVLFSCCVV
jgi:hypothetical protein